MPDSKLRECPFCGIDSKQNINETGGTYMRCRKCGSEKMGIMPNKKNPAATDLYCLECGAWQKFATRDEIRLYQTRKSVITNADRIRSMSDEEMAEFLWNFNLADVSTGKMGEFGPHMFRYRLKEWLQHPAEGNDHA